MTNVYNFPPRPGKQMPPTGGAGSPFDDLTASLVMAQARAGTLNPNVIAALLAAVRLPVAECGR
jgi:hypothetical protein